MNAHHDPENRQKLAETSQFPATMSRQATNPFQQQMNIDS